MLPSTVTVIDSESDRIASPPRARRRWLLGLEPVFEGGWLHKGARARSWDVEETLVVIALLGDVVVDLGRTWSLPAFVELRAYALLRDIEVVIPQGTAVELTGRALANHVSSNVPDVPEDHRTCVVRVVSHAFRGDVLVRTATEDSAPTSIEGK